MRMPIGIQDEMEQLRNENKQLRNENEQLRNSNSAPTLSLNSALDSTEEVNLVDVVAEATPPHGVLRPKVIGEQIKKPQFVPPPIHKTGSPKAAWHVG